MKQIFLAVGSNLNNPPIQVRSALSKIKDLKGVFEFRESRLYETTPVDCERGEGFVNAACTFTTDRGPQELFSDLMQIEKDLGKTTKAKNESRPIDIDVLLFGDLLIDSKEVIVPHPRMLERLFVIQPLLDLTDSILVPKSSKQIEKVDLLLLRKKLELMNSEEAFALNS